MEHETPNTAPTFTVSSRSVGHGKTQQITIPQAIACKLPQGVALRWELSIRDDGLFYRYLGTADEVAVDRTPDVHLPFVGRRDRHCGRTDLDPHTPHHWIRRQDGSYGDEGEGVLLLCPGVPAVSDGAA